MRGITLFGLILVGLIVWGYSFAERIIETQVQQIVQQNAQNIGPNIVVKPSDPHFATLRHLPPMRYRDNAAAYVSFGTVESHCGKDKAGCVRVDLIGRMTMHLPNPCYQALEGDFPSLACHELGHVNGWGGNHHD